MKDERSKADRLVSIEDACRLSGVLMDSLNKRYCPFGFLHSDGGLAPIFKLFTDTNSAYCFRCRKAFTPTTLYAECYNLSYRDAATRLLHHISYSEKSLNQQFHENMFPAFDPSCYKEALLVFLKCLSEWSECQYDSVVLSKLDQCMNALSRVTDHDSGKLWLEASKNALRKVIGDH